MSFFKLMAGALGLNSLMALMGPTLPIHRSSFRKRGRNHKKMMKNPPNRTGWFQRHADLSPMVITERMLMRHGWYRRQLRNGGIAIEGRGNSIVLKGNRIGMVSGARDAHLR